MNAVLSPSSLMNDAARQPRPLHATPAGTYFAISAAAEHPLRTAVFCLLAQPDHWPAGAPQGAGKPAIAPIPTPEVADRLLQLDWASPVGKAEERSDASLEQLLPELLAALSADGCALLADHQGLQMAVAGFDEQQASGLAALSSEAIALGQRHRRLMRQTEGATPASWAMVDAAGSSQLGVWPLFIGGTWFALVIQGRPLLAQPAFVRLVRSLVRRVAASLPKFPGKSPDDVS